jgi:sialic acid synthase SpsE
MTIATPSRPIVIAEAGVNHNGDRDRARALIDAAAEAGADIVKFQAFTPERLVARNTATTTYQLANAGAVDQRAMLAALALTAADFEALAHHCQERRVEFLCTAFDPDLVAAFVALGMKRIKVASGELTNSPALRQFARNDLPILLSTGMATLDEVERAVEVLRDAGAAEITLLHCTSLYPAPLESLNLSAMATMSRRFGLPVGYSDHSLGDHAAIAAAALGATIIEKHFTLDRALPGPDHRASLEPDELAAMIRRLREVARALGDGVKAPAPGEIETARLVRRSWHAARALSAGAVLAAHDVVLLRPAPCRAFSAFRRAAPMSEFYYPCGGRLSLRRVANCTSS